MNPLTDRQKRKLLHRKGLYPPADNYSQSFRRPVCGPAGAWQHANPTPGGDERPFRHYNTSRAA